MLSKKFLRRLRIIRMFSPGYDPQATVMDRRGFCFEHWPADANGLSAEEAFFFWESRGETWACRDIAGLQDLRERKAGMDITVSMWKEDFKNAMNRKHSGGYFFARGELYDMARHYPVSFLKEIGLLDIVGLTMRQLGRSMGSIVRQYGIVYPGKAK